MHLSKFFIITLHYCTVSKNTPFYFLNDSVKDEPISLILALAHKIPTKFDTRSL